jgi:uncharacterized membrane protein (DUF4010 family)
MDPSKVFLDLALALGAGLLVGLQRERAGSAIAGIRTFPLITLAGAVAATLPEPASAWGVACGLLAIGALCFIGNWTRRLADESPGVTTEAAMVLMFLVGALVVYGPRSAAVAVGAAVAVLLHAKPVLQQFTKRLGEADLRAIMQFAVITLIILPVAPNQSYGPFGVLNPYRIWLMVVLIVGISLAAYVAHRMLGERHGAALGGLLGGLISSTATTASFARRASDQPAAAPLACLAILIASTVLGARLLVVLYASAPQHWLQLSVPVGILIAVGIVCTLIARLSARGDSAPLPSQENPTQLKSALIFAAMFAGILFVSAAAQHYFGNRGIFVVSFLSGLTDMDAIALSVGGLLRSGSLDSRSAVRAILIAFIANTIFKSAMAGALGGRALLVRLAPLMGLQIAVAAIMLFRTPGPADAPAP